MVFLTKVCFPQLSVVMLLVLSKLKGRAENQTGLLHVSKADSSHTALCIGSYVLKYKHHGCFLVKQTFHSVEFSFAWELG